MFVKPNAKRVKKFEKKTKKRKATASSRIINFLHYPLPCYHQHHHCHQHHNHHNEGEIESQLHDDSSFDGL